MCKCAGSLLRLKLLVVILALALFGCISSNAFAATSNYIPGVVSTATTTVYSNGSTNMNPGRVGVDKAGNVFYISHVSPYTLYEVPAATPSTPVPLISGLAGTGSNAAFVDASGVLWVTANAGTATLVEIPAANGIPNTSLVPSGGLALGSITTACTAAPTTLCFWGNSSIATNVTASISGIVDVYSDGAGNVFIMDDSDATSGGAYDRIIRFNTSSPTTGYLLADSLGVGGGGQNTVAQLTVAGDGNVYYVDSKTNGTADGNVYLVGPATATTAATLPLTQKGITASIGASVQIASGSANGISTDPWGNLVIVGTMQISEIPLESGSLNFADEFSLVNATGQTSNFPIYSNNINYGGAFDIHGNFYYASYANVMKVQIGGFNFGNVAVGTLTTSPSIDFFPNISSCNVNYAFPTATTGTTYGQLQSFPYGGSKNFYSGCSAITAGNYLTTSFQPVHPGLLRGSFASQTNINSNYPPWVVVNLQGVGIGPQTMLLPGTASPAMVKSSLYTSSKYSAKVAKFTPGGLALDTYGDIFVADSANGTVDVSCASTTQNATAVVTASPNSGVFCQGYYGYSFKLGTSFVSPSAVALDGTNSVYVLDSDSSGNPVTLLQNNYMNSLVVVPNGATVGGTALNDPQGITLDGYGNIYIADTGNNRIVQAHQYGATYAQSGGATYAQTIVYVPSTAKFGGTALSGPTGLAVDAAGNLFIADTGNNRIVEYSVAGVASVVSISGITLKSPTGVSVLPSGALIVSDKNNLVSLIDNGVGTELTFNTSTGSTLTPGIPAGVALDLFGNIYVSDPANSQIVELNVNTPAMPKFPATPIGNTSADVDLLVYNAGTAPLIFSAAPFLAYGPQDSTKNIPIGSQIIAIDSTTCSTSSPVLVDSDCVLAVDFTPEAAGVFYTTATLTDNVASVTGITSATIGSKGTFATPASSSQTAYFSSTATPQIITFANPGTQTVGTPLQLVATTNAPGMTVSFAPDPTTTGVCTVSGTTATFIASGTCTIIASQNDTSTGYAPTSVSQTFTVNGEPQTITFNSPGDQLYVYGMSVPLVASTTATGLSVSFTSTTTSVCTINTNGTAANILQTGTCTITANQAGTSVYAAATAVTQSFDVSNPVPVIGSLSTTNVSWATPTFTLTVNGTGFVGNPVPGQTAPTSTVYWGSTALATTYVSPTQLTAVVNVYDTDQAGIFAITVQSPTPGGGTSNPMQFEVDSQFAAPTAPNFATPTATVTAGSTATYAVTLPSTATNVSASCLNLPTGATCSYASNKVSIATTASTPKGTYLIAVVFTETVPGTVTVSAFVVLPFLLAPVWLMRRKLASRGFLYTACIGLMLMAGAAFVTGCGGSSSATTATHQVTSSSSVTLTVQ